MNKNRQAKAPWRVAEEEKQPNEGIGSSPPPPCSGSSTVRGNHKDQGGREGHRRVRGNNYKGREEDNHWDSEAGHVEERRRLCPIQGPAPPPEEDQMVREGHHAAW